MPKLKLNYDDIIAEVAKKHRVAIADDDPVFITVSLSEAIMNAYNEQLDEMLNDYLLKLAGNHKILSDANRELVNTVLNHALTTAKQEIHNTTKDILTSLTNDLHIELKQQAELITANRKNQYWLFASSIIVFSAAIATALAVALRTI